MSKQVIEKRHSIHGTKSGDKKIASLLTKTVNLLTKLESNLINLKTELNRVSKYSYDEGERCIEFKLTDKIVKKCHSLQTKIEDDVDKLVELGYMIFDCKEMNKSYFKRHKVYVHMGAFLDDAQELYQSHYENVNSGSGDPVRVPVTDWVHDFFLDQDISCINELRGHCEQIMVNNNILMSELKKVTYEYVDKNSEDKDDREITVYTLNSKSAKSLQSATDAFFNNWDAMESYGFDCTHHEDHFETYSYFDQVPLYAKFVLEEYNEKNNSKSNSSRESR